MNPLKQINAIFAAAAKLRLNATEQLILLHLNDRFNRTRWQETLELSDSDLLEQCGLNVALSAFRRIKARLAAKGLISYLSGRGNQATIYRLVKLYECDTSRDTERDTERGITAGFIGTCAKALDDTPRDTQENSYIRARAKR